MGQMATKMLRFVDTRMQTPDKRAAAERRADWQEMPETQAYPNGFRAQWEMFIRHVVEDAPFTYTLREGAKGLQLVEAAETSARERRWIDLPDLRH